MSGPPRDDVVVLRGGPTVRAESVALLLALADRGVEGNVRGGRLMFSPPSRLGAEDWRAIREHRRDIEALLEHVERVTAVVP